VTAYWYEIFLACVLVLWALSTPRDRNALRIVLIASLFSEGVVELVTHQITGAWKLAIPGAVETLTIVALFQWARNRTGYLQISLLSVAWLAHLLCYFDVLFKTDLVYSRYEAIIQTVAVGQLAACHDTVFSFLGRCRAGIESLRARSGVGVPVASLRPDLLPNPRREGVQTTP
jgi:hypothetical protein